VAWGAILYGAITFVRGLMSGAKAQRRT
jgi:hypothetical protein